MLTQTKSKGITFSVHDVEPVLTALETRKTRELLKFLLRDFDPYDAPEPLYLSGYNSQSLVETGNYHALLSTIHLAFSQHRPLILSPDMIWITILQGFAQHVKNNTEELRHLLVNHAGKERIEITRQETFVDSPEYDWESVIHDFAACLNERVAENYSNFVSDFSTTGPLERVVCEVALLDVFQSYFEYIMYCVCGIPEITLEGSPDDWMKLREKVEFLAPYKLDWWLPHLREITEHFHRAANGDVDKEFWQDIYKQMNTYGADTLNGWIVKLIPYVRSGSTGDCIFRNPVLSEDPALWEQDRGGIRTNALPSGLAQVPFTIELTQEKETKQMQFLAGFVGAEQDTVTSAVRPMLGWAVRKAPASIAYLFELPQNIEKLPPQSTEDLHEITYKLLRRNEKSRFEDAELPGGFFTFYKECDGLNYQSGTNSSWKIRSITELERVTLLDSTEPDETLSYDDTIIEVIERGGVWLRFLDESDGSWLALQMGKNFPVWRQDAQSEKFEIVAQSFEESIRAYLDKARALAV